MELANEAEIEAVRLRINALMEREDLSYTAFRVLAIVSSKPKFTSDDLAFLELVEKRYGISQ